MVIACALEEPVLQVQKDPKLESTSPRPTSRKGTFFCVTGRHSVVDRNNSGSEFDYLDENRKSQTTTRNLEDKFTANRNTVGSDVNALCITNGKLELISRV